MKSAARLVVLSIVAAVALTGCMRMQINLDLHSDDTVSGSMVLAVQEGIGETFGMSDEDVLAQITADGGPDIEGATVEDYNEDGFVGQKYTFEGEPLEGIGSEVGTDTFTITREGDTFVVDGPFDTGEEDTSQLAGADLTFSVTFPGEVTEHNGTLEGTTVTWDLLDAPESLHAVGGATEGSSFPVWIIIVIAVVVMLGLIAVVGFLAWNARKKAVAAPADDAAAEGVEGAPVEAAFVPEPAVEAAPEAPVADAAPVADEAPAEGEPEEK